jgi:sugar phosphate permease
MREALAKGMTYGGGGTALIFGWDANTLVALIGAAVAVAGLAVTWHYQRKRDRREQEAHDRRMAMFGEH